MEKSIEHGIEKSLTEICHSLPEGVLLVAAANTRLPFQRNKVKKAVSIFDMMETIDSVQLGEAVNERCKLLPKVMPILIEINSGKESNKTAVR